ncbi:MAG: glucose 1-dehydrogenase [Alphaproteobacteria bacterium]|nr:glucose 1-dehydrogenase [Alphaproteobacteria bacterium]
MRLATKVAIITGAASGMGAATAKLFAREGATVVIADVLEPEGREIAAEIGKAGGRASFKKLDVTDEAAWKAVVAAVVAEHGRLDILVNNAGLAGSTTRDYVDTDAWDALMAINAKGVFLGIKYAVPPMRAAGGGSIVNLSSLSGNVGQSYTHMGYNASKGAVRTLTKQAAVHYAKENIRVNSIHPGVMPPMRTAKLTADPVQRQRMIDRVPMGRAGRVEEVAYPILFLASDEASYITGAELWVDGGYLAA